MQHYHQNAFTHRLERVYGCWEKARKSGEGLIYRWLIPRDEISMIDGFYNIETTEQGYTDDIFLRFYSPFESAAQYSQTLSEELCSYWAQQKEGFAALGLPTDWTYDACPGNTNGLEVFFYNLNNLCRSLQISSCVVVFLSPDAVAVPKAFEEWLTEARNSLQPQQLCLMLIEEEQQPLLKKLPKKYPVQVVTLQPKLEMKKAIAQVAASGNPDAADTIFRKYYLQLADAATKKDLEGVQTWGKKALQVGEGTVWHPVKVGVWVLMANAFTEARRYKDALHHYAQGSKEAQLLLEEFPEQGRKLLAQCKAGIGNVHFIQKEYSLAMHAYQFSAEQATAAAEFFYAMEGWRMAAMSALRLRQYNDAQEQLRQSFAAGQQLPLEVRQHSTFPEVGKKLYELSLDPAEKLSIRQQLDALQATTEAPLHAIPQP